MGDVPYDIERYLNIRSAHSPDISSEGRLSFLMDTTGVPQVWTLDAAGEWPVQRTFHDERVTFASWSPTREEFVYGMDEGGNERVQLFRLAGDGSEDQALTNYPSAKHQWGGWSHDGERIAFSSNRRNEAVFDVYTQSRTDTGDDATLVAEGDGGWLVSAGWSPSDDRLALLEPNASFDYDVYVLDLDTGSTTHLTPHEGNIRYQSLEWGPEGDGIYCVTDADADTLYLARLDAETGDRTVVEDGGEWNIGGVTVDQASGRIGYTRNVDGYTEATVGNLAEGTITNRTTPDLPGGVAAGIAFDDDAERLAMTVTASDDNTNVYLIDAEDGASTRWTRAATAGIPRSSFIAPDLIRYASFDDLEIPAYFSTPTETDSPYPVVVDIHGGPESQRRPAFRAVKQYLLSAGYAVFEPNVRGSSGYGAEYSHLDDVRDRMDSVADIAAGVEWLTNQSTVDSDRIVAYGGSYGGFMVLAALTEYPDLWAAGVDVVGIANFVTFLENTGDWRREHREAEYGSLENDRAFLEEISPINNIDSIQAPLLVLHGRNDPRVPVGEAEQIADQASNHVPVETLIFDDEGHGFSKLENRIEAYRTTVEFLEEHV